MPEETSPAIKLQNSPVVHATNMRIAHNALANLDDGAIQFFLEGYLARRYGNKRAAALLQNMAREVNHTFSKET